MVYQKGKKRRYRYSVNFLPPAANIGRTAGHMLMLKQVTNLVLLNIVNLTIIGTPHLDLFFTCNY